MAKIHVRSSGDHKEDRKDIRPESKELMEIESVDDAIDEVEKFEESEPMEAEQETVDPHLGTIEQQGKWKRFWSWFWRKKFLTIPAVLIIIFAILAAVPFTRYGLTSWFWNEPIAIQVIDDGNERPVTEATVVVAGQTVKTDAKGIVKLAAAPVGLHSVTIEKKNYETSSGNIEVPLFAQGKQFQFKLHATGRISDITVTNRISGKVVVAALITITKEDRARTDESGKAQVVIPTDKKDVTATVEADGYLDAKVTINQADKNQLKLIPSGKLYFLSKQRGDIDVVKTNFDGSDRQTVVEGTGQEDDRETSLLASRDWKYLVLKAKRDAGKQPSIYIYDTIKGSLELVDQGNTEFTLIGWSGHNFFYQAYQNNKTFADTGQEVIKVYNAEANKISIVDENQSVGIGPGSQYRQSFSGHYITDDGLVYIKTWFVTGTSALEPTDKSTEIVRVASDGKGKKVIKAFPSQTISYIEAKLYEPQAIYYRIVTKENSLKPLYAELENGVYREGVGGDKFDSKYPTYLMSPNGSSAFWSESRDGKNTLLLGGKNAENKKELASKSEFKAYGWFTDDYLLMQKGDSELYITSAAQLKAGDAPLKISDYHKPTNNLNGYGYGYGGQ